MSSTAHRTLRGAPVRNALAVESVPLLLEVAVEQGDRVYEDRAGEPGPALKRLVYGLEPGEAVEDDRHEPLADVVGAGRADTDRDEAPALGLGTARPGADDVRSLAGGEGRLRHPLEGAGGLRLRRHLGPGGLVVSVDEAALEVPAGVGVGVLPPHLDVRRGRSAAARGQRRSREAGAPGG